VKLAWMTDLHLDHASPGACDDLWASVRELGADAVLVGGDTATGETLESRLRQIRDRTGLPTYFVLGNHDCYGWSIAAARALSRRLTEANDGLTWLGAVDAIALTASSALLGHDGWGDGGCGNSETTPIVLNDFLLIDELRRPRRGDLRGALRELGAEAPSHRAKAAEAAARSHDRLLVLTHVPPFREAAWHEGAESHADWLPFFVCRAAGEALVGVLSRYPRTAITVLSGHTHGGGECSPAERITVVTGRSEFGKPRLQRVIEMT
jgi:3',5'-cyclic AMP phosphodiesterase CpdA